MDYLDSWVSYCRLFRPYLSSGFGIVGVPFATCLAFFFAFFSLGESFVPLFCFLGDLSPMSVHLQAREVGVTTKTTDTGTGGSTGYSG